VIRGFLSELTMKLPRQAKTNYPMSRPAFHHGKASENSPNDDPDNQASNGNKGDGHGDTTSNREPSDRENSRHRSSYDLGSVTDYDLGLFIIASLLAMGPLAAEAVNRIVMLKCSINGRSPAPPGQTPNQQGNQLGGISDTQAKIACFTP
jgi:hypothetical protein